MLKGHIPDCCKNILEDLVILVPVQSRSKQDVTCLSKSQFTGSHVCACLCVWVAYAYVETSQ